MTGTPPEDQQESDGEQASESAEEQKPEVESEHKEPEPDAESETSESGNDEAIGERLSVDRRTVLGGTALGLGTGTLGYLLGGGSVPSNPAGILSDQDDDLKSESEPHLPFDVWEDTQGTLRTMPTHLPGRAAGLVDRAQRRDELAAERAAEDDPAVNETGGVPVRTVDDLGNETAESDPQSMTPGSLAGAGGVTGILSSGPTLTSSGIDPISTYARQDEDGDMFEAFDPETVTEEVLETLFEFVRDKIHTVPTTRSGIDDVTKVMRWGGRGALRCGMGTPRDKAQALALLYREAGFTATVRETAVNVEEVGLTEEEVREDLLTPPEWVDADSGFDDEELEEWAEQLDNEVPDESEASVIDEGGEESMALAESLRAELPEDPDGPDSFDWRWNSSSSSTQAVPIVEVFDDEHQRYHANLFADVPFGETGSDNTIVDAPEPEVQSVSVSLSAARPGALDEPFELVSGEWAVPDLIGRQLLVRTGSILDPVEMPMVGIDDMDMFIPSLVVQDPNLGPDEQAERSEFGDMVTLSGDQYSANLEIEDGEIRMEDETISKNGEVFYDPENAPDAEAVDTLSVEADSIDHPRIRLNVTAVDEDGDHVAGLPSAAFAATDEGVQVTPTILANRPEPEILYLIDVSGSMSGRGRRASTADAATDEERHDELQELMAEPFPGANIERREVDSDMWSHLPEAVADNPDLIVYAHDGEPASEYDERVDSTLAEAPPTVLLSADDKEAPVEDDVVLHQAELTDAEVAPMGEWDLVRETVEDAVRALDPPTYRLDYEVPDWELGRREVDLFIGEEPVESPHREANATYVAEESGTVRTLVGLYLTIELDGYEVTRTLGGWDPHLDDDWNPYDDEPDPDTGFGRPGLADFAFDTKMAFLGGVDISFEGDGVPAPVAFDDMLEARQSYREVDTTMEEHGIDGETEVGSEEHEALLEAREEGTMEVQWDPTFVQAPLPNRIGEDGLTYFLTPRIVISQTKAVVEADEVIRQRTLDIPPMVRATTAADDPEDRYHRTLERTARMSVLEAARYDSSTLDLIGDAELSDITDLADDIDDDQYRDLRDSLDLSHQSHTQIAPADGSELAFWNVHDSTGTMLGIMPDGTGGAVQRQTVKTLSSGDRAQEALGIYEAIMDEIDCCDVAGSGAQGKVAGYFEFLAALYARVTAVIAVMDAEASVGGLVSGAAGDVAEDKATDHWIFDFWELAEATGM